MREAQYLYEQWGASAKVKQLQTKYPHLVAEQIVQTNNTTIPQMQTAVISGSIAGTTLSNTLDLGSVMKASQIISGEIVMHTLLTKMMTILIENAGAETGCLLLKEADQWLIQAQSHVDRHEITVLQSLPINTDVQGKPVISNAVIQYVAKTKHPLVLGNAAEEVRFSQDPYIIAKQPKSVLCSPIVHQNKLIGLVYLENNLTTDAFTAQHFEILMLLSSQTAISLENAHLYANLENKVQQRTIELEKAHQQILVLEKEATEKQMAGGFAHEIRNALVSPKLIVEKNLGLEGTAPYVSINLANNRAMKAIYVQLKPILTDKQLQPILNIMQTIFANEERMEKGFNKIYGSLSRALLITQNIMDYAKLSKQIEIDDTVNLDALIQTIMLENEDEFKQQGITIQLDLNAKDTLVSGNQGYFYTVFNNLILNAKDALLENKSQFNQPHLLHIVSEKQETSYHIQIIDNGVGIPEENLSKIYDAFFSTKPDSGTGLGMGFVQKIVSKYQGHIKVSSQVRKGTTFSLCFPIVL